MSTSSNGAETRTSIGGDLSAVVIPLLKGVVYQDADGPRWNTLLLLQPRLRDFVGVLGLELIVDEAEGFAFLRSQRIGSSDTAESDEQVLAEEEGTIGPRLVSRRQLSFPVSLILALLRKKLAEFDAQSGDTRLVLSRDEIVDLVRLFMADGTNETRIVDQIDGHINKIVDLGFLVRLRESNANRTSTAGTFEVKRILKAFVDAQWLTEFNERISNYRAHLAESTSK
jgi:hypothetical protein